MASLLYRHRSLLLPLFLLGTAAFLMLRHLGAAQFMGWDEAVYAQIANEVVHTDQWLTLHWQQHLWFEKPPFFLWMMAAIFKALGPSEFAARLVPALSGIGLVLLTYEAARHSYGRRVGFASALMLLTCAAFVEFSRMVMTDIPLCLFIYISLYSFLRTRQANEKWWIPFWIAFALAAFIKGPAALVCVFSVAAYLVLQHEMRQASACKSFWIGVVCALAILAPWHAVMLAKYGHTFLQNYFVYHVIHRTFSTLEGSAGGISFHFRNLLWGFRPWSFLALFAVAIGVRDYISRDRRPLLWLLLIAIVMGLYTTVQTKLEQYILPVYPALAILTAVFLERLSRRLRAVQWVFVTTACIGLLLAVYKISKPMEQTDAIRAAKLARVQPASQGSPLLFCTNDDIDSPAVSFYSGRPVLDCERSGDYLLSKASFPDAAWGRVTQSAILVDKQMIPKLPKNYAFTAFADAGQFAYGEIRLIR